MSTMSVRFQCLWSLSTIAFEITWGHSVSLGPPKWNFRLNNIWFRYHHTLLRGTAGSVYPACGALHSSPLPVYLVYHRVYHHSLAVSLHEMYCVSIRLFLEIARSSCSHACLPQCKDLVQNGFWVCFSSLVALVFGPPEVPLSISHFSYSSVHFPYHALLVRQVHRSAQEVWCVFSVRRSTRQGLHHSLSEVGF